MKRYDEWKLQQEFAAIGGVDDLQVKELVKRRLEMLFSELEKMNMSRPKAIEMLALILREFQQNFDLNANAVRAAAKVATLPPAGMAQPPMGS